jgi:Holliday junction resolvase RusA-like endonuclease
MPNWAHWPDLVGLLQATSDILTEAGIIEDDMWVANYDGSEIVGIDKANSRVEIEFIPVKERTILYELRDRRNTKRAKR